MSTHSYSLRSRVSSSSLSSRTPTQSPLAKPARSPRKGANPTCTSTPALQLKHVIGTTTTSPSGLSCCARTNAYAYCAGSVAVFATIDADNVVDYRYFKARPKAVPINHTTSFYDSPSTPLTPTRRRTTVAPRKPYENYGSGTISKDWSDDSGTHTWSARERIKAASCVSISPDGNILAVGEIGFNPRVLLFSTAANASVDIPLSIMTDHTVGVRSVAFSPDSRCLATLGDVNDGFLYIWQVNTRTGIAKLRSSNKCTTNVCDMTWCGSNVITVGTRHVKVWQAATHGDPTAARKSRLKPEENTPKSTPKPLQGRNCLLGPLVDATFTAVVSISEDRAIICADDGHLCLLDLGSGKTELSVLQKHETMVAALTSRQNPVRIVWAGGGELLEEKGLDDLLSNEHKEPSPTLLDTKRRCTMTRQSLLRQSLGLCPPKRATTVAIGCLGDKAVSIDADGTVRVLNIDASDLEPDVFRVASHNCAIRGVQRSPHAANLGSFFTWAGNGDVRFWGPDGTLEQSAAIEIDEDIGADDSTVNELKVLRCTPSGKIMIAGDQYGVVKVIEVASWDSLQTVRAHGAEINDINIHEASGLVATCSRDRMIQVFTLHGNAIELLQTLDDHISSVSQILFSETGNKLFSCSTDRSVVVRDRIERKVEQELVSTSAFISTRTITLKATPLSMSLLAIMTNVLVVSTSDRHILQLDPGTGVILTTFKVSDRDSDDTVALNSLSLCQSRGADKRQLLAGFSAIDKSVRIYDLEKGAILGRDSGHTEGISDLIILDRDIAKPSTQTTVVSTGLDGTIMIWTVGSGGHTSPASQQDPLQAQGSSSFLEDTSIKGSPALLPPLRKILSKMDVTGLSRQTSPTRDESPNVLRRRTSRLNLAMSIEETDETVDLSISKQQLEKGEPIHRHCSPDSVPKPTTRLRIQQSQSDMKKAADTKHIDLAHSPSPPNSTTSLSLAPKQDVQANNGRLRRPPSVPNDLRAKAIAQGGRPSIGNRNDVTNMATTTDQTCHLMRTYRRKLMAYQGSLDLSDIESELEALSKVIRQKHMATTKTEAYSDMKRTDNRTEDIDIMSLSELLERTGVS